MRARVCACSVPTSTKSEHDPAAILIFLNFLLGRFTTILSDCALGDGTSDWDKQTQRILAPKGQVHFVYMQLEQQLNI